MLAVSGVDIWNIAWATRCAFSLLRGGLIQRAAIMQPKGRSLSSSIALRVSGSSMAVLVGTNGMTMLYVLLLIVSSLPDAVASFLQFVPIFSHCAASLLESSSRVPPLWSTVRDFRLRSGVVSLSSPGLLR